MLSVIMLNVIMLSVVMLSVAVLRVVMLNVIIPSVIVLSVVMLNVIMPSVIVLSHYAECLYADCRGVLGNIWFFYILCRKYFVHLHQQQTHFSSPSLGDIETCTKALQPSMKYSVRVK